MMNQGSVLQCDCQKTKIWRPIYNFWRSKTGLCRFSLRRKS